MASFEMQSVFAPLSIDLILILPRYVDSVNSVMWPNSLTNGNRDTKRLCLICYFILIEINLFLDFICSSWLLIHTKTSFVHGLRSSQFLPSYLEIGSTIGGPEDSAEYQLATPGGSRMRDHDYGFCLKHFSLPLLI